jgi:hypothetical protein
MTELGEAFKNGPFVPYASPWDNLYTIPHMLMGFSGSVLLTLILVSIFKTQNTERSMKLVVSLCMTDLLYCSTSFVFGIVNVSSQGWAMGYYGCIVNTVLVIGMACSSLLHIVSLSMERYISIFYQIQCNNSQYRVWVMTMWVISTAMVLYPLYTGTQDEGIDLGPSLLVCAGRWSSRKLLPMTFSIVPLVIIFLSTGLNLFVYSRMIISYMKIVKAKESHQTNAQVSIEVFSRNERKLLIKAAFLTISYFICWAPYAAQIFIALISGEPVSRLFDAIGCLGCLLNSCMNPVLLYIYDHRIKKNFGEYWGFDLFRRSRKADSELSQSELNPPTPQKRTWKSETVHLKTTMYIPSERNQTLTTE